MSSIKEVASEAGVSTATVSHVINGTRFVSDEVRARVLEAVEKCRYYPNAQARGLASGKSRIIGLVISDIANPFFPELVKAIEWAAFEKGYDVILANTNYNTERTAHYVRRFFERKVAGVAIMTSEMERDLIDELEHKEVPTVFLDVGHAGTHMNNILVDYDEGIRQAIQYLAELGHRRIAFIGGPSNLRSARRRLEAFRGIMAELFPDQPELIFHGNFRVAGGRAASAEILRLGGNSFPTAVMAGNDLMAIGAISEFESEGVNVPRDVSVVGFDDIAFAAVTRPPLTTVHLPLDELGQRAVGVLLKSLEDIKKEGIEIRIQTELIIRDSTGPAPERKMKRQAKNFEKQVV